MPVAIDTSILVHAEKFGGFEKMLPDDLIFYIPAHAAAEFLVGAHLPESATLRERARRIYETDYRRLVDSFEEADAAEMAALLAELRRTGKTMGFFDAAIAATALARGDSLLALDDDFDRLQDRLKLLKP